MHLLPALAIAGAGLAAGTVNTVVGSGTLITFPTFVALGYPPLVANVSNTIGLVPGSLSGIHAYRRELAGPEQRERATRLGVFTVAGAVVGSVVLLVLPGGSFRRVVPFLILAACALVAAQPAISRRLRGRTPAPGHVGPHALPGQAGHRAVLRAAVFLTGVYGGYFGAAQGVVLVALLAIFVDADMQRLNALKNVLAMLANLVAGVIFAFSGHVNWALAGVMAIGAVVGGQLGGFLGRRLPAAGFRGLVVAVGTAVAISMLV